QRRLAMIDVANRANVHMRLVTLEFTFCHSLFPWTALTFSSVECGAISDYGRKTQVPCGRVRCPLGANR
ncbi:hypothetical protein NKJ16_25080, partial [Mesorhizobium sp. M0179]|uniref:hypothetical protein n=1 Tax=unclassified Mesorhizobium TaxID=325217 RepID=UPI003334D720